MRYLSKRTVMLRCACLLLVSWSLGAGVAVAAEDSEGPTEAGNQDPALEISEEERERHRQQLKQLAQDLEGPGEPSPEAQDRLVSVQAALIRAEAELAKYQRFEQRLAAVEADAEAEEPAAKPAEVAQWEAASLMHLQAAQDAFLEARQGLRHIDADQHERLGEAFITARQRLLRFARALLADGVLDSIEFAKPEPEDSADGPKADEDVEREAGTTP